MLNRIYRFFTSLKLTVALLALGLCVIFFGTMAQDPLGLHLAQERFFKSFFVDWMAMKAAIAKTLEMGHVYLTPITGEEVMRAPRIPVFPGGYLIGTLLILNLFAAHLRYYQPGKKKWGIVMIHLGVLLLLLGQFLTDFLSLETTMHIRNGETLNYSEADREFELAVTDTTSPQENTVVAIAGHRLAKGGEIALPELPFTIRVKKYFLNSAVVEKPEAGYDPVQVTDGLGQGVWWRELPRETSMERRDMPSGIIEIVSPKGSQGTFLISGFLARPQNFTLDGRTFEMTLRPQRFYKMFSLHLLEFRHDKYPGTEIPRNFSSRVRLDRADTGESREVLIYMNNPLRYGGETFYQSSFDPDDQGTVLQVVRNPGWLTPYFACVLVAAGLAYQFLAHLTGFIKKRSPT